MARGSRRVGRNFDEEGLPDFSLSDEELERLMELGPQVQGPGRRPSGDQADRLAPGSRVRGTVIDNRGEEILVELDAKTHGIIPVEEFQPDPLPPVGSPIEATFVRYDAKQRLAILSVTDVRREVFWESVQVGTVLEGLVTGTNKGGLTLKIKNIEAFMPLSHIDVARVEDPETYVGKRVRCEVISVEPGAEKLVVSRRAVLEREARERRQRALEELIEGQVLLGTVVKLTDFGAFIDIGGVEGLLHKQKIIRDIGKDKPLEIGQKIEVEIARIDLERGRVALNVADPAATRLRRESESGPQSGDVLTGWVRAVGPDGVTVAFEEGGEGILPAGEAPGDLAEGSVVRVVVLRRDPATGRATLKLA